MAILFDFLPIALFVATYRLYDIYVATEVFIAAAVIQLAYSWFTKRRLQPMVLVSFAIIAIMGGLTLYLHDEIFIKWKPTVANWFFGLVFLGSHWIGRAPLVKQMMESLFTLPNELWVRLNVAWWLFFFILGSLNLFVIYTFDTDVWVTFKLAMIGAFFVFFLLQVGFLLARYGSQVTEEN